MRDGSFNAEMLPAIGEGIGGDVDDAHHLRPIQPQQAAGAIQSWCDIEHQYLFLERIL
ncbi:hypothetical protein D3C72_2551550 [compost metagenome]